MGLFDILKKKKDAVQITQEVTKNTNEGYSPWTKTDITINSDYAIAAFIKMSERGEKVGRTNDDYARYFNYRYGVSDPLKYHKRVIADGYLVEAPPEVALEKLKLGQLKAILSNAGLPDKGNKSLLISRIIDDIGVKSLNLEKYYVPSEKGAEHLRKYGYAFDLPRYNISFEEFNERKKMCADNAKPNDVMWQILNNRFNHYNTSGSFGLARNEILYMAILLKDEGKYVDALYRYVLVLYYDVNTCPLEAAEDTALAPSIVEQICKLKEHYDERIISRCYDRYKLPHQYINRESFERLLFDIFEDKEIDIKNYTNP